MNSALSAICEREENPRLMPPPPTAHHDCGDGRTEAVPLVNRDFLMKCGTEALYLVLQEMDARERFDAETKEDLANIILEKTQGQQPDASLLPPPMVAPIKAPARVKRERRQVKARFYVLKREAMRGPHGSN